MTETRYNEMTFEVPTLEGTRAELQELETRFDDAADTSARVDAIRSWKGSLDRRSTWDALVDLRFHQDTGNAEFKSALDHKDALSPQLTELDVAFKQKLLNHADRAGLEAALGRQAFALWDADSRSFAPAITEDLATESRLTNEYTELLASARIEFAGQMLNLSTLGKYLVSDDRAEREGANLARWAWFDTRRGELDRIYDDLARLRHGMARKLELSDYVELGYLRMQRIDYDRADVDRLRAQIRDQIVPLCTDLREQQREMLGVDTLRFWDEDILSPGGNPRPKGDHDWMVARAQRMFDEMGHGLGEFFRVMTERGLLDLKSRDGKAGGGFCTAMPSYGVPFVFANFNGTQGDVEVLTHEIGHAFQAWCAPRTVAPGLLLADDGERRDSLDESRVPHVAVDGALLRGRRRALPPRAPHGLDPLPVLRHGGRTTSSTSCTSARTPAPPSATPCGRRWSAPTFRGATTAGTRT